MFLLRHRVDRQYDLGRLVVGVRVTVLSRTAAQAVSPILSPR